MPLRLRSLRPQRSPRRGRRTPGRSFRLLQLSSGRRFGPSSSSRLAAGRLSQPGSTFTRRALWHSYTQTHFRARQAALHQAPEVALRRANPDVSSSRRPISGKQRRRPAFRAPRLRGRHVRPLARGRSGRTEHHEPRPGRTGPDGAAAREMHHPRVWQPTSCPRILRFAISEFGCDKLVAPSLYGPYT